MKKNLKSFLTFLITGKSTTLEQKLPYKEHMLFANEDITGRLERIEALLLEKKKTTTYKGLDAAVVILRDNHIEESFISYFIQYAKKKYTIANLHNVMFVKKALYRFISDKLLIYTHKKLKTKQRICMLVGTSGSGKTTAILHLALRFKQKIQAEKEPKNTKIRILSIDNDKIATAEYLEKISSHINVETELLFKCQEIQEYTRKGSRPDILLIDTPGQNPNSTTKIGKLYTNYMPIIEKSELFLVINANMSKYDILSILEQFKLLQYVGIIITKLDEATHPERVLGICMEYNIPIAYISKSQRSEAFIEVSKKDLLEYFDSINYHKGDSIE